MFVEKSGPPSWKQLPAWFQVSENDCVIHIHPDAERNFAKRMNATTLSLNSSHASLVSHPNEIAELILNATKEVPNNLTSQQLYALEQPTKDSGQNCINSWIC